MAQRRRKRYLDNVAPADNTVNVVRPVNRMIQVKQQDTPARREKETREYQARMEQGQKIMNTFARTPAGRRAANRAYAVESQKAKQEAAKEEAAAVVGSLFKPLMPSTYVDIAAAIKNGQVNNLTDALAASYLSDSWSMRNPGKALVTDVVAPFALSKGTQLAKFAGNDIADSWKLMRYQLAHPESQVYRIVPKTIIDESNYLTASDAMWDEAYTAAINAKDIKEAQRLRDLHSLKAGKSYTGYHGQLMKNSRYRQAGYNPYSDKRVARQSSGYFTSSSEPVAHTYNMQEGAPTFKIYSYLNNPYIVDAAGKNWETIGTDKLFNKVTAGGNYDGVIIKNVMDVGPKRANLNRASDIADDIITISGRAKLADAITYDDLHQIIPLSKRDNFNKFDVRYGLLPFIGGGLGLSLYNKK